MEYGLELIHLQHRGGLLNLMSSGQLGSNVAVETVDIVCSCSEVQSAARAAV